MSDNYLTSYHFLNVLYVKSCQPQQSESVDVIDDRLHL